MQPFHRIPVIGGGSSGRAPAEGPTERWSPVFGPPHAASDEFEASALSGWTRNYSVSPEAIDYRAKFHVDENPREDIHNGRKSWFRIQPGAGRSHIKANGEEYPGKHDKIYAISKSAASIGASGPHGGLPDGLYMIRVGHSTRQKAVVDNDGNIGLSLTNGEIGGSEPHQNRHQGTFVFPGETDNNSIQGQWHVTEGRLTSSAHVEGEDLPVAEEQVETASALASGNIFFSYAAILRETLSETTRRHTAYVGTGENWHYLGGRTLVIGEHPSDSDVDILDYNVVNIEFQNVEDDSDGIVDPGNMIFSLDFFRFYPLQSTF